MKVKYCDENDIEFLAVNRNHGWSGTLGAFNGITINLSQLQDIKIASNGKSALFGGGSYSGNVIRTLWEVGYVTTSGACDCVGMMGPALGGGHGRLQSEYGYMSDNVLQFNVVLGNGDEIVVSEDSHSELFWAMRGAGHNFGIVTSYEMKIYPKGPETWHYHNYCFRGAQLEEVFEALNEFHGDGEDTPIGMMNQGTFIMNTSISTEEPVILWNFAYRGTAEKAEELLAIFNDIEAVYDISGDIPYPQVAAIQGTDEGSNVCKGNVSRVTGTAGLRKWNVTSERLIFDGFARRTETHPELTAGCAILHQGYGEKGVQAQDSDESAYAWRDRPFLTLFQLVLPDTEASTRADGQEWADEVGYRWNAGDTGIQPSIYVNYAAGGEPLEQIYGYEEWRLERLCQLKGKYDPCNRFRFFNPIKGAETEEVEEEHTD